MSLEPDGNGRELKRSERENGFETSGETGTEDGASWGLEAATVRSLKLGIYSLE